MATGRVPTTANSPLTAKGDLFTYSTAPARLAVGNSGETIVADSSTSTGLRYTANFAAGKNKIINGDFTINQRAFTTITGSGTGQYGFDRWKIESVDGSVTYTPQTFTPGTAPVTGYEAANFARVVVASQTTSAAYSIFSQGIEDVRTFANQTVTISFWAKAASGTPKVAAEFVQVFGSGGSPSANVNTSAGQSTITTSWARYTITANVPSISGKTIGTTANTSQLALLLWTSAGSNFNSRTGSMGIQNNTIDIWGVQVEAGSVATAFQTATGTIQGELAACQRYYYRQSANGTNFIMDFGLGTAASTTSVEFVVPLPVQMRVVPTSLDSASLQATDLNTNHAITSPVSGGARSSVNIAHVSGTVSGATQYRSYFLGSSAGSGYIGFSAEL
jgi:hypothetical protein